MTILSGNFLQEFQQKGKNFYVRLERSHYFGSKIPELGSKICFKIDPIVSDQAYVFSERKSDMAEYADTELQWEEVYYPIVRLEWDNGNPTKPFVKIVEIVQKNWLSPDNQRATLSSTKSKLIFNNPLSKKSTLSPFKYINFGNTNCFLKLFCHFATGKACFR